MPAILRKKDYDKVFLKAVAREVDRLRSQPGYPDFRVQPLETAFADAARVAHMGASKSEVFRAATLACALCQAGAVDRLLT